MSKLFKSKILLGVMMLGLVFGGFAVSKASAADCSITMSLSMGMRNSQVTCLQNTLGVSPATGYFGSKTKAAVVAWQAANGLPSTGLFGSMSRAKLAGGSTTPVAGCPAGMTCTPTSTTPAVCPAGFTCTSNTGSTVVSGTNGYLTDIASDSTNRVSTVYESETDKVVAGFRATARLSSQNVNRVRVVFKNTDTGASSVNLAKYISGASLWMGSTKLATMSVADADRSTSNDSYTFNFSGLNGNIAKDQIGRFYVSVNVNGSLDSTDATNANWAIAFPDGGVSASSPDGSYDTYNVKAGGVPTNGDGTTWSNDTGFTFGKFSANGVKATVSLSSSNPSAATIPVSSTAATNGVTLLKFTVKATNSDLTLRKIPVQVTSATADVASIINTIKVYNGSNLVDSLDGSSIVDVNSSVCDSTDTTTVGTTGCYIFSNLSSQLITSGSTAEFSIVADLKKADGVNYSAGDTLTASFVNGDVLLTANFSAFDANGDQLTAGSTYRVGSAVGNVQTLRENGVNVVMGSTSVAYSAGAQGVFDQATYTIPLTVTSFGNTVYVGQSMQVVGTNSTISSTNAFGFAFQKSSAPTTDVVSGVTYTATLSSSDATLESGTGYRLDSGTAKHFTVQVTIYGGNTAASYRVALDHVKTWTDAALSTGGALSSLLPAEAFRTGYQLITK